MAIKGQNLTKALTSDDYAVRKSAQEGQEEILQTHVRGDCIVDKFIPPQDISEDDLDPQVNSVKPMRFKEMDTRSPGAISMAFGGAVPNYYMHIPRYLITYHRLVSFRLVADVSDLLTYRGDITRLYHDYLIKDIIDQKDRGFLLPIRTACGDLNDTSTARANQTGAVGYTEVGTPDRQAFAGIGQSLAETRNNLSPATVLVNNSTMWDFMVPDHDEVGGPAAEEIYFNGFQERTIGGLKYVSTVKNQLIKRGDGYVFAEQDTLGDNDVLKPVSFVNRSEAWYMDMQCWTEVGGALPNLAAFARFDLSGSYQGWSVEDHTEASPS